MSDLPTLWVYGPSLTQAMATPADRVARVSAFLRRDHDESREYEFVPAAQLEEANLEIATLKAALKKAIWNAAEHDDGCLYCGEGEIVNGTTTPEHRAVCWFYQAERLVSGTALTPKELSDE